MSVNSQSLLNELSVFTKEHLSHIKKFQQLPLNLLLYRVRPESWNVLECIAHLSLYADFYIKEIKEEMGNRSALNDDFVFKSGWLGNYFAKSMMPGEQAKKMKTFKNMDPIYQVLDKEILVRFQNQLEQILQLLKQAESVSLNRIKVSISIAKFIKLKLGDAFRVLINHNERHMQQAELIIKTYDGQIVIE